MSCLKTYISILYCCNCWYNYECIFVIAPWGTLIGIKYCIVLYWKAFHCAPTEILFDKLSFYGVSSHSLLKSVDAQWNAFQGSIKIAVNRRQQEDVVVVVVIVTIETNTSLKSPLFFLDDISTLFVNFKHTYAIFYFIYTYPSSR